MLDITKPNNILGFHYALAVQKQNPSISLQTIPREHAGYHDEEASHDQIASATAIRKLILAGKLEEASHYLPASSIDILRNYEGPFLSWTDYWSFLQYRLIQASTEELEGIRGVSEGIQNRMQQAATKAQNFSDFIELTKTKRYSNARLQRTALQILLNAKSKASSPYIRILGMNKTGQKYLSLHKKNISLPIVTTVSKAPPGLLEEELRATNIYTLVKIRKLSSWRLSYSTNFNLVIFTRFLVDFYGAILLRCLSDSKTGGMCMVQEYIRLRGARENNLQNISLDIPKRKITIFTGVSGSGKSSIVFETIATESQRQLNETYSAYLRNFLPKYTQPDADSIENLSTSVIIDQKRLGGNSRSTLGTITDINSILRLLFSRVGKPSIGTANLFSFNDPAGMCPDCHGVGQKVSVDLVKLLDPNKSLKEGAILFPTFSVDSWYWNSYAYSGFLM